MAAEARVHAREQSQGGWRRLGWVPEGARPPKRWRETECPEAAALQGWSTTGAGPDHSEQVCPVSATARLGLVCHRPVAATALWRPTEEEAAEARRPQQAG